MDNFILGIPKTLTIEEIARSIEEAKFKIKFTGPKIFVVENDNMHVILIFDDSVKENYDNKELDQVIRIVKDPTFCIVEFDNKEFVEMIMSLFVNRSDVSIDDDHGNIIPGDQFARNIEIDQ